MSGTVLHLPAASVDRAAEQYCTFWVDGLFFGVSVMDVQEVLRYHDMTVVPRAPESVHGLINLRGQIVTAIDLRTRLGLPRRPGDRLPMNVVLRSRDEVVSLLVDDIGDVIDTSGLGLEPAPVTLPPAVRGVLHGVLPLPESILLVLDPDLAADVAAEPVSIGGIQ
jgi:purine-binding chemotaxis protein CheW